MNIGKVHSFIYEKLYITEKYKIAIDKQIDEYYNCVSLAVN